MGIQRTRRVRPLKKASVQGMRKRPHRNQDVDLKDVLLKLFIGIVALVNIALVISTIRQCSQSPEEEIVIFEEKIEEPRPIQIEVLNGCGVTGVAAKFTDYLRGLDFDVVKTDNYESFNVLKTVIVDRRGNRQNMMKLAEALKLPEARILEEVNEAYLIDAVVILGKDFRQLQSWQDLEN